MVRFFVYFTGRVAGLPISLDVNYEKKKEGGNISPIHKTLSTQVGDCILNGKTQLAAVQHRSQETRLEVRFSLACREPYKPLNLSQPPFSHS